MKIKWSAICVECDEVFELSGVSLECPSCGNSSYLRLDKLLENKYRDEKEEEVLYCDDCDYLTLTEEEQQEWFKRGSMRPFDLPPHRCGIHQYELKHNGQHPRIPKPPTCTKTYKKRSN